MPPQDFDLPRADLRLNLLDLSEKDERPELAVYLLDRSLKLLHIAEVGPDGEFKLPEAEFKRAARVAIGPRVEDIGELDMDSLLQYRPADFAREIANRAVLDVVRQRWQHWLFFTRCVSGSVSHCYPYPWIISTLAQVATRIEPLSLRERVANPIALPGLSTIPGLSSPRIPDIIVDPIFPIFKCETVCDGFVEVYQRTRCCTPILIGDLRIPDIRDRLEEIVPDIPVPPRPDPDPFPPDPLPWQEVPFIKEGAIDEKVLRAGQDLMALNTLKGEALAAYINARPYLFCTTSTPKKVADGFIQPDGKFQICWRTPLILTPINCSYQYAYVVKQVINGVTVTIYNGLAANQWFDYGDDAALVSYHPQAIGCRHNEFEGDGAFVLLEQIGNTDSFHLKTPASTGWDRVALPDYNDGLAFPAANAVAAKGQLLDRNWGGSLLLYYHFSEEMKDIGATYYRIGVSAADANGDPTGPRTYLSDGVAWKKLVQVGPGDIDVVSETLGPDPVAGLANTGLFKIPYDADAEWVSGQYHGVLVTSRPEFSNGRHLLTLEVFDAAGNQLKPNSAPAADPGTAANFTFQRWVHETGPGSVIEVPFGALTHMLWWDNRSAQAVIVDLRKNGMASVEECQFIEGAATDTFSAGYRAYHPNEMFQLYHRMWSRRGLGGPVVNHTVPTFKPDNVGVPPAPEGSSTPVLFSTMLDALDDPKCSFALNLRTYVKTFDGRVRLSGLDASDQAAFALEIV